MSAFEPAWAIVTMLKRTKLTTRLNVVRIALFIRPPGFGNCAVGMDASQGDQREHRTAESGQTGKVQKLRGEWQIGQSLCAPLQLGCYSPTYSYRSAIIGSTLAARHAGM